MHDATGRIQRHIIHVAIYADRPIGPDGILDEFWGCDRYLDLVDPVWIVARQAIQNRVIGSLFAHVLSTAEAELVNAGWDA